MEGITDIRPALKKVLRSMNATMKIISRLERDPPITELAFMQMNGDLKDDIEPGIENDIMKTLAEINQYRRKYWKLENKIKQTFLSMMKRKGYLPGNSPEIDSLKSSLPSEMIKGDERLWIYSFDHYIKDISVKVGRSSEDAPNGKDTWEEVLKRNEKGIAALLKTANEVLPGIYMIRSRITAYVKKKDMKWSSIRMKRPKLSLIERPLKRAMILKRPIPLPKRPKKPRKKVLKRPKMETIGPGDQL